MQARRCLPRTRTETATATVVTAAGYDQDCCAGSDLALDAFPVGIAELAFVELAAGVGHLGGELDGGRTLVRGEPLLGEGAELLFEVVVRLDAVGGSTTAITASPQSGWGTPNTATSPTFGWVRNSASISAG